MTRRPVVSLGDLVRAARALEVTSERELAQLAAVLGIASAAPGAGTAQASAELEPRTTMPQKPSATRPDQAARRTTRAESAPVAEEVTASAIAIEMELLPPAAVARAPREARDLDALLTVPSAFDAGDLSLFDARWQRGIVAGIAGTQRPAGAVDVERVVEDVAAGRALATVPRLDVHTTRSGLQVLVDIGDGMRPFIEDVASIEQVLRNTAGDDGVELLRFERTPARGVGAGTRSSWKAYAAPAPGTPILVLSDFGLAGLQQADAFKAPWEAFARTAAAAACPVVALTPFPASRWPAWLAATFTLIPWDRGTNAGAALRAARAAARRMR